MPKHIPLDPTAEGGLGRVPNTRFQQIRALTARRRRPRQALARGGSAAPCRGERAVRAAAGRTGHAAFYQRDGSDFIECAFGNENLWASDRARSVLNRICWEQVTKDHDDLLYWNRFKDAERRWKEQHPDWFRKEEEHQRQANSAPERTFKEALKSTLWAQRALGQKGAFWYNYATALVTLDSDLGQFSDKPPAQYDIDEAARNRLLAHARQDAAQTLLNTSTLLTGDLGSFLDYAERCPRKKFQGKRSSSARRCLRESSSHSVWLTVNTEKLPRLLADVVPIIPAPTQSAI